MSEKKNKNLQNTTKIKLFEQYELVFSTQNKLIISIK